MAFRWLGLVFCCFLIFAGSAAGVDWSGTCAGKVLGFWRRAWNIVSTPSEYHSSSSLMMGLPPGVTLDDQFTLEAHVRDLFEYPTEKAWMRVLDWPLRRRFKHISNLGFFFNYVGPDPEVTVDCIGPESRDGHRSLKVSVRSVEGAALGLVFDESPYGDMHYYICRSIYIRN